MTVLHLFLLIIISLLSTNIIANDILVKEEILPPLPKWNGKSEQLIVGLNNPWQTPAEKSNLSDSPNYETTFKYLERLVESDKRLQKLSIGKSPQGRDIWMIVATKDGHSNATSLIEQNRPTLLVQAGIHSGEIDGKDAGMMLLRDIVHGNKGHLLDNVNLLFVPILSVDGHERRSPFNRVNQRGPVSMGWRTNAQNLNLNRDYSKLDTPELQHLVRVVNEWQPDLYLDVHVTDGEDYQYDITYGYNLRHADSPNISQWLDKHFRTEIDIALHNNGHLGGPLIFGIEKKDFSKGIYGWTASPRYSNGYGDVRHLPTVLVENHSLKPYRQRVLGTYVLLEQSLKTLASHGSSLRTAIKKDRNSRADKQVLKWKLDMENPELNDFAGIEYIKRVDDLTGIEFIQWNGKPKTYKSLPTYWARLPDVVVNTPEYYWIPPQFVTVIERLSIHGIEFERMNEPVKLEGTELVVKEFKISDKPFEGHQQPTASFDERKKTVTLPVGSVRVATDQSLGKLAVALLDPRGPDSLFAWGFFNQIFQRTEYIEDYALIPLIRKMIKENPALKEAYLHKKSNDEMFAKDAKEQLRWFYQRSAFYDSEYLKYPVLLTF